MLYWTSRNASEHNIDAGGSYNVNKEVIKKEVLTKIKLDVESPLSFKLKGQNLHTDDE